MLLKATFKRSFWVLFGVTSAVTKKWLAIRMARYIFMSAKNMPSSQYYIIYSPPLGWPAPLYSAPKRCEQHQPKNRLCRLSAWQTPQTPPNCWRFHDNLYQIHFSGCSALHESRRQSPPHPYSSLRAPAFFRISRNRVQANNPHLNKSFGMSMSQAAQCTHPIMCLSARIESLLQCVAVCCNM